MGTFIIVLIGLALVFFAAFIRKLINDGVDNAVNSISARRREKKNQEKGYQSLAALHGINVQQYQQQQQQYQQQQQQYQQQQQQDQYQNPFQN